MLNVGYLALYKRNDVTLLIGKVLQWYSIRRNSMNKFSGKQSLPKLGYKIQVRATIQCYMSRNIIADFHDSVG